MMPPDFCVFEGQFILSKGSVPDSWHIEELEDWILATHPQLPVRRVFDRDGAQVGWLLGYAVPGGDTCPAGPLRLCATEVSLTDKIVEEFVYSLGGRFAVVLLCDGFRRIYLDPAGTLATVYSTREPVVASTCSLLSAFATKMHPRDEALLETLAPDKFFPAGVTPFQGVERLLPNHYFDLQRWVSVRHWLKKSVPRVADSEIPVLVERIADRLRQNIDAVAKRYSMYLGLTAGKDSRMILACSRDWIANATAITFDYGSAGKLDLRAASHIARRFGIRHQVLPVKEVPAELKCWYLERIGYVGGPGKVRDFYHACKTHLQPDHAFLTGFTGEVGRQPQSYKIRPERAAGGTSVAHVLDALRLPHITLYRQAVEKWLVGTQCSDASSLTAQMYLELRVGCWASPHMYGIAPFAANLTPFCHREIYRAMLSLPRWYWGQHRIADDVVNHQWPELASVPYDRFPGVAGLVRHAGKRIRQRAERAISSFP